MCQFQVDAPDGDDDDEDSSEDETESNNKSLGLQQSAVDFTEQFIRDRLGTVSNKNSIMTKTVIIHNCHNLFVFAFTKMVTQFNTSSKLFKFYSRAIFSHRYRYEIFTQNSVRNSSAIL